MPLLDHVPSLAQSLPLEVFELILSYRFMKKKGSQQEAKAISLSLVCRAWWAPVYRLLFRSVTVLTVQSLLEMGRKTPSFSQYVQALDVNIHDLSKSWRCRDLNIVLEMFTNLTSFTLHLKEGSPGCIGTYSSLQEQPNLKKLNLKSEDLEKGLSSFRQILSKTPNITTLNLSGENWSGFIWDFPLKRKVQSIHLHALTCLSLDGPELSCAFDQFKLLTKETLGRLKDLALSYSDLQTPIYTELTPAPLLRVAGASLHTLTLPRWYDSESFDHLLSFCPNLEKLIFGCSFHSLLLPASVKIVKYHDLFTAQYHSTVALTGEWIIPRLVEGKMVTAFKDWSNIERFGLMALNCMTMSRTSSLTKASS